MQSFCTGGDFYFNTVERQAKFSVDAGTCTDNPQGRVRGRQNLQCIEAYCICIKGGVNVSTGEVPCSVEEGLLEDDGTDKPTKVAGTVMGINCDLLKPHIHQQWGKHIFTSGTCAAVKEELLEDDGSKVRGMEIAEFTTQAVCLNRGRVSRHSGFRDFLR